MIGWNDVYNVPWPEYLLSLFFWLAAVRNGTQKDESMQQFMRTASIMQSGLSVVGTQLLLMQWSAPAAHLYSQERLSRMWHLRNSSWPHKGQQQSCRIWSVPKSSSSLCRSVQTVQTLHLSPGCVTPAVIHLSWASQPSATEHSWALLSSFSCSQSLLSCPVSSIDFFFKQLFKMIVILHSNRERSKPGKEVKTAPIQTAWLLFLW